MLHWNPTDVTLSFDTRLSALHMGEGSFRFAHRKQTEIKRSGNRNALPAGAAKLCIPNASCAPRLRWSAARSASTIFAGQYLRSPAPLGGGLVTTEWFKPLRRKRIAAELRPHRSKLGHRT
jgi:hypothetical protein